MDKDKCDKCDEESDDCFYGINGYVICTECFKKELENE